MAIKPLQDNLIVRPLAGDEVTAGGIVLPDSAKEKPQKGTIVAVGPGKVDKDGKRIPIDPALAVGAIVLYKKYSTTEIKENGEELLIIDEDGILGIVE